MTASHWRAAWTKGLALMFVGLAVGALAGWIGLVTRDGAAALAALAARFFPALYGLVPLGLLLLVYLDLGDADRALYRSAGAALVHLALAGLGGGGAAGVMFMGAAAQIPAVFGDETAAAIIQALAPALGLVRLAALPALGLAAGLILAWRAGARVRQ